LDIWIGTSGYSYPDWVGDFYPKGTKAAQMLSQYARSFPLVELNFTFYRTPTREMLQRQADKVPPGFSFVVKVPQTISHVQSPDDLPAFRQAVLGLRERGQLLGLLCQLPQSNHKEKKNLQWLQRLAASLGDLHLAVEFRHRTWADPEVAPWLAERGLDLVAVDVPNLPGLYPRGWVTSGPRAYVRLHSRDAANWYKGEKERYDYDYPDDALREWLEEARSAAGIQQTLFLFNNCYRGQAAANARRMEALFAREAPGLNLVPPFAAAPPAQRSLFD
jgi:uncharacterized protein YecE (DUF72 family)